MKKKIISKIKKMKLCYQINFYSKSVFAIKKIDLTINKMVVVSGYHLFMSSIVRLASICLKLEI